LNFWTADAGSLRGPLALWLTAAVLGLLAVVATAMVYAMLELLSGGRAYVHGESRWSRAQQSVVFQIDRYAETGNPRYLQAARRDLLIPLGDREARLALQGPVYDYQRAFEGLLQGRNHPDDIAAMIRLLEYFENAPYFREAIDAWTRADVQILRLQSLAARLEDHWRGGQPDPAVVAGLRRELISINRQLRPLAEEFSSALGEAFRYLKAVFLIVATVAFLVLMASILLLFRWAIRHITASERKFWATVEHAPVGVAVVAGDGGLRRVNDTLCDTLGYRREALTGLTLADILDTDTDADKLLRRVAAAGETGAALETQCRTQAGEALWCKLNLAPFPDMDSERPAGEYIAVLEDVSEARRLSERLSYEAAHDPLTGLLNRRRFESELQDAVEHARARGLVHTVGFADLDHFKHVNDKAGHLAGDRLLTAVATAMQGQLRSNDSLARIGGDEFGFILHGCDIERGLEMAKRLRGAVRAVDFPWQGERFEVSLSIGLSELSGTTADSVAVMQAVDQACYLAKKKDDGIHIHVGALSNDDEGPSAER